MPTYRLVPQSVLIHFVVCCALISSALVAGCSSSSSSPMTDGSQSVDLTDSNSNVFADQMESDVSLSGSVLRLTTLIKSGSLAALAELNQAYVSGILAEDRVDCVDQNNGVPVLEYYCGEDGVGERLNDFGYPAFALSVENSAKCRDALLNNTGLDNCTLTHSNSEQAGSWYVKYSLSKVDGMDVETLTLSDGVIPEFVEFEAGGLVCEIKLFDQDNIQYSDEPSCRVSVTQVLAILQTP